MPVLRNKPYFFIKQIPATSKNHSKYLPVCQGGSKRHNNGTHRQQAEIYAETNGTHAVTTGTRAVLFRHLFLIICPNRPGHRRNHLELLHNFFLARLCPGELDLSPRKKCIINRLSH